MDAGGGLDYGLVGGVVESEEGVGEGTCGVYYALDTKGRVSWERGGIGGEKGTLAWMVHSSLVRLSRTLALVILPSSFLWRSVTSQ